MIHCEQYSLVDLTQVRATAESATSNQKIGDQTILVIKHLFPLSTQCEQTSWVVNE